MQPQRAPARKWSHYAWETTTETKNSWSLAAGTPKETQSCSNTEEDPQLPPWVSVAFSAFTNHEFKAFRGPPVNQEFLKVVDTNSQLQPRFPELTINKTQETGYTPPYQNSHMNEAKSLGPGVKLLIKISSYPFLYICNSLSFSAFLTHEKLFEVRHL